MDVKCTVYRQSNDKNENIVDIRIFVHGLKPDTKYTAHIIPDHDQPLSVTTKTDYEGILWAVGKIPNGENSLLFKVDIYKGNNTNGPVIMSGDDDAPCYPIRFIN